MRFLIRSAFGLGLLFLLVPLEEIDRPTPQEPVGALDGLAAAREALYELAGLCDSRPDICVVASATLATIAARAKETLDLAGDDAARAPEKAPPRPVPDPAGRATAAKAGK